MIKSQKKQLIKRNIMNINKLSGIINPKSDQDAPGQHIYEELERLSQQPRETFIDGLSVLLLENDDWHIEYAINTCDHAISDSLMNDQTVKFLLDNNVRPYLSNMTKCDLSPETIRLVLHAHPESIQHLPGHLITYEMAATVVKSDPSLYQSLPARYRTPEIAKFIYPSPGNYYNLPPEITEHIFELWLSGDFVFKEYAGAGNTRNIGKPNCADDIFALYRNAFDSDRMNNQLEVMTMMTPFLLAKFDAAECWNAARNETEQRLVIMAFGKEHLITHADIDNRRKRDWIGDGFGL